VYAIAFLIALSTSTCAITPGEAEGSFRRFAQDEWSGDKFELSRFNFDKKSGEYRAVVWRLPPTPDVRLILSIDQCGVMKVFSRGRFMEVPSGHQETRSKKQLPSSGKQPKHPL